MKHVKLYEEFDTDEPQVDLSMEWEYKLRTLDEEKDADYNVDNFYSEFGIASKYRSDFAYAAMLKNAQKYKSMSDEEFFKLYDEYKNKK